MPNYCDYYMKVSGKNQKNIEEFIKIIQADYNCSKDDPLHFWRVFEADAGEITYEKHLDLFTATISGYCAWSVSSCMFNTPGSYQSSDKTGRGTCVENESKRLSLVVEIYSEEPGMCFQEHYLVKFGNIEIDNCVDYHSFYLDDYDGETEEEQLEEINKWRKEESLKLLTLDDFDEDGRYSEGGFEWTFEECDSNEWNTVSGFVINIETLKEMLEAKFESINCRIDKITVPSYGSTRTIIMTKPVTRKLLNEKESILLEKGEFTSYDASNLLKNIECFF